MVSYIPVFVKSIFDKRALGAKGSLNGIPNCLLIRCSIYATVYKGKVKGIRKVDGVISIIANDGKQDYSVNLSDVMSISEMDNSENTASILSVGYPEIVYGIGGIAIGVVVTLFISRKKKVAVGSTTKNEE